MALSQFIRNLITTDSVFGSEAKKLSGINDRASKSILKNVSFDGLNNTITVAGLDSIPSWLVLGKAAIILGSNLNNETAVRIDLVQQSGNDVIITVIGDLVTEDNVREIRLDGRIFAIINDRSIAREAENGSTMFNVDNNASTNKDDGSGVALKYAAHYHSSGDIVSHECNEFARTMFFADSIVSHTFENTAGDDVTVMIPERYTDAQPQVVFDNDGNVVGGNS